MDSNVIHLVSADVQFRDSLSKLMEANGMELAVHPLIQEWLDVPEPVDDCCVILDVELGDLDCPTRLKRFATLCASPHVLVTARRGDVPMAVLAMKHGAAEVLQKSPRMDELLKRVNLLLVHRGACDGWTAH